LDLRVVGLFTNKAVVVVDGGAPRTLAVGQRTSEGITLLSIERDSATFDLAGTKRTLKMGQMHATSAGNTNPTVTLTADSRGHFVTDGQINGGTVRFIVDTGATLVSLSAADAKRLGLDYQNGQRTMMSTANGVAPAFRVKLDSVKVGGITLNGVDAVVMDLQAMPVLLGMSFLNRMEMRRDGDSMTLTRRY
jgi:aspartyl protease family protein